MISLKSGQDIRLAKIGYFLVLQCNGFIFLCFTGQEAQILFVDQYHSLLRRKLIPI